jgi:hypothetical protein
MPTRSQSSGNFYLQISGFIQTLHASNSSSGDHESVPARVVGVEKDVFHQAEDPCGKYVDDRAVAEGHDPLASVSSGPFAQRLIYAIRHRGQFWPVSIGFNALSICLRVTQPHIFERHITCGLRVGITKSLVDLDVEVEQGSGGLGCLHRAQRWTRNHSMERLALEPSRNRTRLLDTCRAELGIRRRPVVRLLRERLCVPNQDEFHESNLAFIKRCPASRPFGLRPENPARIPERAAPCSKRAVRGLEMKVLDVLAHHHLGKRRVGSSIGPLAICLTLWVGLALGAQTTLPGRAQAQEAPSVLAHFTTGVENREPIDQVTFVENNARKVFFFTELRGLNGQTIRHRWIYAGEIVADVSFEVRGPRWRVWSSKDLLPDWIGDWTVEIVAGDGEVIAAESFTYSAPEA